MENRSMTAVSRSPVIRVLVPFALGVLAGLKEVGQASPVLCGGLCLLLLVLQALLLRCRSGPFKRLSGALLAMFLALVSGMASGGLSRPRDPGLPCSQELIIGGKVGSVAGSGEGRMRFDLKVLFLALGDSILETRTWVKTYLHLPEGEVAEDAPVLREGDFLVIRGTLSAIENAGNPREVDYAGMYRRKGTWYRFYAESEPRHANGGTRFKLAGLRERIRQAWTGRERSVALLQAICLGDKSQLDALVREDFARAGAMHILAVSGLHTGIIWWVLNRLLSFLVRLSKSEIPRMLLVVILLWGYAWLTGFSPSVSRAVCMFSLFSLAILGGRRSNTLNTVLLSMMILLLVRPGFLLDAGFQLSYIAVLSIVGIFPLISRLMKSRNKGLRYLWDGSVVSLSAQLGTLALGIHYFHRIPVYGLLSNLVSLPLLTLIVGLFVLSLPANIFPLVSSLLGKALVGLATLLDESLIMLASLPMASVEDVSMDGLSVFIFLLLLGSTVLFMKSRRVLYLSSAMFLLSFQLLLAGLQEYRIRAMAYVQVSNFRNASLVSMVRGKQVDHYFWCRDPGGISYLDSYISEVWSPSRYTHSLMSLQTGESSLPGSHSACIRLGPDLFLLGDEKIRISMAVGTVDEFRIRSLGKLHLDAVLLSHVRFPHGLSGESLRFGLPEGGSPVIIADGSNSPATIRKIKEMNLEVFDTATQGAFVFSP